MKLNGTQLRALEHLENKRINLVHTATKSFLARNGLIDSFWSDGLNAKGVEAYNSACRKGLLTWHGSPKKFTV